MCLNQADFAKNISFKSYAAICLPQQLLDGCILVWERVHAPLSGIQGVQRSAAAGRALHQLLVWGGSTAHVFTIAHDLTLQNGFCIHVGLFSVQSPHCDRRL